MMSDEPNLMEPDILSGADPLTNEKEIELAKADLEALTEEEFENRYKSTKRLYRSLMAGLEVLKEVHVALQEPAPMEFDSEIIDSTMFLMQDLATLMDQMHMASYWEREGM